MTRASITFILLSFFLSAIHAQIPVVEDIDEKLDLCLNTEEANSTRGMEICYDKAINSIDNQIERLYAELGETLDDIGKRKLAEARQKWLDFRESELELMKSVYDPESSLYTLLIAQHAYNLLRSRHRQLEKYNLEIALGQ